MSNAQRIEEYPRLHDQCVRLIKERNDLREAIEYIRDNHIPDNCTCSTASDGSPVECQSCGGRRFIEEVLDQ